MITELSTQGPTLIGGIPVTPFSSVEEFARSIIRDDGEVESGFAIAVNAEKVVRYRVDSDLRRAIEQATVCYPDGISIVRTLRQKGVRSARVPGVEVWEALMQRAAVSGTTVFIAGSSPAVNEEVVRRLRNWGVKIAGNIDGFVKDRAQVREEILSSRARIVTVAMGSPVQEILIAECRERHPEAFYMGVGGTYDVFVGTVPRAPRLFRSLGLEWLYRLIRQPTRARRQLAILQYAREHLLRRL